jgi:hypothetical protein
MKNTNLGGASAVFERDAVTTDAFGVEKVLTHSLFDDGTEMIASLVEVDRRLPNFYQPNMTQTLLG